jgi:hypothetical protein
MLGVQRSAITIAAGALQRKKLISYKRGKIFIVSRRGLEGQFDHSALDQPGAFGRITLLEQDLAGKQLSSYCRHTDPRA